MSINKIAFFSLLIIGSAYASESTQKACDGNSYSERTLHLASHADILSQQLKQALQDCKQNNNCQNSDEFKTVAIQTKLSFDDLTKHYQELAIAEEAKCNKCEKKEVKKAIIALETLLRDPEIQEIINTNNNNHHSLGQVTLDINESGSTRI